MGYKVRHYAANTPGGNHKLNIEAIILELSFGAIAAVFAFGGWEAGMVLLAIPCTFVALACFYLVVHSVYLSIRYRLSERKKSQTSIVNKG